MVLEEVDTVFTAEDNAKILQSPTCKDVKETVCDSNLHAAPGCDGIPSLLYKECWSVLGTPLTEVMVSIHHGHDLPRELLSWSLGPSQRSPTASNQVTKGKYL